MNSLKGKTVFITGASRGIGLAIGLRAARDGAPVREIARRVFLSPGTVRNHLSSAIGKTATHTRAEAIQVAEANGWL